MRNTTKKQKVRALVMLVIWMAVIFAFSATPGDTSAKQSGLVLSLFKLLGINTEGPFADTLHLLIRKGAHFSVYFLLYLFALNLMACYLSLKKALWASLAIVFLYACTDEIHQLFVPGRAGRFLDVMIDTAGGAFAMGITYLIAVIKSGGFNKK